MAAAPLTISADRQLYVNFSAPFDLQPYTFMHARPKGSSKALLFVDPFTPLVSLSQTLNLHCCFQNYAFYRSCRMFPM